MSASWKVPVAAAILGLFIVVIAAARLTPPAVGIADRYLTLDAILVIATIVTAAVSSRQEFDREHRLLVVVLLVSTGMAWYSGRLWVHEKMFDYLVLEQKTELHLRIVELSGDMELFLRERARQAPPKPAPATWDRDVQRVLLYEAETAQLFEVQFGPQVRKTREILALERVTDRDFDAFYRRPANAFQINVVAERLLVLAKRLEKT
ncbi:MAG TPA: hypothetical protein VGG73_14570 [Vicinamibacterales bacterium]